MTTHNHDWYLSPQADNSVTAQTITEQRSIIFSTVKVACFIKGLLNLDAQFLRLLVQTLRHYYYIDNVLRTRGTKICLTLHHLTNYKLKSHNLTIFTYNTYFLYADSTRKRPKKKEKFALLYCPSTFSQIKYARNKLIVKETLMNSNIPIHGYLDAANQVNADISIAKGRAIAGAAIGILVLDLGYPYLPGNVANASTYNFPVRFKVLKDTSIPMIMAHDPALLDMIIEGGKELQNDGVRAIVGACGYFGYYQKQAAAKLDAMVCLSSLMQVQIIKQMLKPDQKVGIVCANSKALSPATLSACGINNPSDIAVIGAENMPQFRNILDATCHFNPAKLQDEIVQLAKQLTEQNPQVGALLLECSDMPPFSLAVQNATGLPVFDFITLVNWLHYAAVQHQHVGFM